MPVLSSSSTSTSPAASTARPDIAITFAWIMRSMPAMPIAESSPPIVVGIRQTSSATSTVTVTGAALSAPRARRRSRTAAASTVASRKMIVSAASRMFERDLVRRLLALRAFDHARSCGRGRSRPGSAVIAHDQPVGEHARAAGHGAAVAAALADHRRALAGDRALVDRGDAFDDLAVARDDVAGLDQDDVALAQRRARGDRASAVASPCRGARAASCAIDVACAPCAARRPAPCRGPPPSPRRSWRTAP